MSPDRTYRHGTFLDGLKDTACVPVEIWSVVRRVAAKRDFWRDWVLTSIVFVLLAIVDPVGVASNSTRASEQLFYRIVSPDYPPPIDPSETADSPEDATGIAVIVINDNTLREFEISWPPPLSFHARVLEKILAESAPKAVFVDFGFFDERDSTDVQNLARILRSYALPRDAFPGSTELWCEAESVHRDDTAEGFTPVFLAAAPKGSEAACEEVEGTPEGQEDTPQGLEVVAALKDAVTGTVSTRYVLSHESPHEIYFLFDCDLGKPSAALAMYAHDHSDWQTWELTECPKNWIWGGGPNQMSVYWASWGSEKKGRGIYPCRDLPTTRSGRIGQIFKIWFFGLMGRDEAWTDQFQTCPPHLAISAHDILKDPDGGLAALLVDRYVFYGGNFAMADDLIEAPTHEPMPGVFLHAMALDNLLRLQPYIRQATRSGFVDGSFLLTLLMAVLMSAFIALAWNGYDVLTDPEPGNAEAESPESGQGRDPIGVRVHGEPAPTEAQLIGGFWWLLCLLVSILVVISGLWFGFSVLAWAPANFVGLLSFLGLHSAVKGLRELLSGII